MSYKVINLTGSSVEIEGVIVLEGVNNFDTVSKAFAKAVLDTEKLYIEAKTPVVKTHLLEDPAHAGDGNLTRFSLDDLEGGESSETVLEESLESDLADTKSQATSAEESTNPEEDTDKDNGESPSVEKVHQMNLAEATAYFDLLEDNDFLQSVVEDADTPTAIVKAAKSRLKALNAG